MDRIADNFSDGSTRACYDYWKDGTQAGKLPRCRDFDSAGMRDWPGWIKVIEVVRDGDHCRFRYRVHGDHLSDFLDVEMTGKFADQGPRDSVRERAVAGDGSAARGDEPTLVRFADTDGVDRMVTARRSTVPVPDDGTLPLIAFFPFDP